MGCTEWGWGQDWSKRVLFSNDQNVVGYIVGILIPSRREHRAKGLFMCCLVQLSPHHFPLRAEETEVWEEIRCIHSTPPPLPPPWRWSVAEVPGFWVHCGLAWVRPTASHLALLSAVLTCNAGEGMFHLHLTFTKPRT